MTVQFFHDICNVKMVGLRSILYQLTHEGRKHFARINKIVTHQTLNMVLCVLTVTLANILLIRAKCFVPAWVNEGEEPPLEETPSLQLIYGSLPCISHTVSQRRVRFDGY